MKISQPSTLLAYLPLYIALEGTEHTLVTYEGPKTALESTVRQETDISLGDPFLFDYLDYKKNRIIIFGGFIKKIFHSLITFNPFIDSINKNNLAGKTIVSYPEPSTSFFLCRKLKEEYKLGMIIQTPFNTELGSLLTQEADIAVVLEPNTTYALRNGAKELISFLNYEAVMTGFSTTKQYYKKNKKQLIQFLELIKKGITLFEQDNKITFSVAKKYFPLEEEPILKESIQKLRNAHMYCRDFKFSDREIREGLMIRKIPLSVDHVKAYLVESLK